MNFVDTNRVDVRNLAYIATIQYFDVELVPFKRDLSQIIYKVALYQWSRIYVKRSANLLDFIVPLHHSIWGELYEDIIIADGVIEKYCPDADYVFDTGSNRLTLC